MESTLQVVQVFGLVAILASAALVFLRFVQIIVGKNRNRIRFGLELILFFTVSYIFVEPVLEFLSAGDLTGKFQRGAAFFWCISVAYTLNGALKRFLWEGALSDRGVRRVPKILTDGVALLLYAAAIMVVLHYVYDEPITAVLATSGAVAFVVGLSAQSTIREVFAGISLNTTKALRLGDYVEIEGVYGRVHEINWRSISIYNPHAGSLYIFPNSIVAERIILNYCEPTELFKHTINFVVEYSASPEVVIRTVMDSLKQAKFVRRDPQPDINILGFTDLGMEYRIRYYFDGDDPWWDAQNEVCMAIWSSLRKAGIRLSIDRHKLMSGDELADIPWSTEPGSKIDSYRQKLESYLKETKLLTDLSDRDRSSLVDSARLLDFTPPNCIYVRGEAIDTLYLVVTGTIGVIDPDQEGGDIQVASCQEGDFIGIESLIGGESSKYNVQALQYCEVYALDSELLQRHVALNTQSQAAIRESLERSRDAMAGERASTLESRRSDQHRQHKEQLHKHIKDSVERIFARSMASGIVSAVMRSGEHRRMLEGIMATCALICTARGAIDAEERKYVYQSLHTLDFFKHADEELGIELFNRHVEAIASNKETGTKAALSAVGVLKTHPETSHLTIAIGHGLLGVHETITEEERSMLGEIGERLGVSTDVEDLVKELSRHRRNPQ